MQRFCDFIFRANSLLFCASVSVSYVLFEVAVYLAILVGVPFANHPYWNLSAWTTPFATYDRVVGYRLDPERANGGIRILDGKLQFHYQDIRANADGFRSNFEYEPKKTARYRVVVYGDSFTAGLYQRHAWTETLQARLNAGWDVGSAPFAEVYNFSFDGGGVFNWERHYFNELKPKYDFDLVVFAICCNDLKRGLASYHGVASNKTVYFGKFNGSASGAAEFEEKFLSRMRPVLEIRDSGELQRYAEITADEEASLWRRAEVVPFRFYGAILLSGLADDAVNGAHRGLYLAMLWLKTRLGLIKPANTQTTPASAALTAEDGDPFAVRPDYTDKLDRMLDDIKIAGKKAILVTIPSDRKRLFQRFPGAAKAEHTTFPKDVQEIEKIAERRCLTFVNGYRLFDLANDDEIKTFWPSRDGHWMEAGSNYFARTFAPEVAVALEGLPRACDR